MCINITVFVGLPSAIIVQLLSRVWLFAAPWTAAPQSSLSFTSSLSSPLLKLLSIESVMPFNHLILCCPLRLLPSVFPSLRVFYNELYLRIRWPKDWSFSFSISPSKWIFRVDSLWDWLVCSPCSPRDSQESSPAPRFKGLNSSALSLFLLSSSHIHTSVQFSRAVSLTLCNPMDCSMPGYPVHYQLPELTQTHVHRVSDMIQPTHPLLSPSPPAFNLSQHKGLFQWVSSLHQVAKVLGF